MMDQNKVGNLIKELRKKWFNTREVCSKIWCYLSGCQQMGKW